MARSRNVKPGLFQNEYLAELPFEDRLFFIGLWTVADYKGCLEYREKRLKVAILPYDDVNIHESVLRLIKSGFVRIYSVAGQRYLKIVNFEKHQHPHKNEIDAGSDIPEESDADVEPVDNTMVSEKPELIGTKPDKIGTTRPSSLLPLTDSLLPIPDFVGEVFEFWKTTFKKDSKTVLSPKRKKKIQDRLKDYDVDYIKDAIKGCSIHPYNNGQNETGTKYTDIELICRDPEHTEKYAAYWRDRKQPTLTDDDQKARDAVTRSRQMFYGSRSAN